MASSRNPFPVQSQCLLDARNSKATASFDKTIHLVKMEATQSQCFGHEKRIDTKNKIAKMLGSPQQSPDENFKVLIEKGPVSVETSLRELEQTFAGKPSWKKIKDGGVLSVPLEEFRMEDPPQPNEAGQIDFSKGLKEPRKFSKVSKKFSIWGNF